MKTKNICKALALAILMPALLLSTACNSDIINNENTDGKGFALPVTVNVTREGDDATKATYDDGTKKLSFSEGDKLFVQGSDADPSNSVGQFAGTLEWVSAGTFSGTITTQNEWTKTAAELFEHAISWGGSVSATLLPAGYESYDYLEIIDAGNEYEDLLGESANNSFATSKKLAVEQLSFETGSYTSGTGFTLNPCNAILNFTITGLAASTKVTASLSDKDNPSLFNIEGDVTTDGSGNATFAMGVFGTRDLNDLSLTVAGNPITLVTESTPLAAGKIYNITRSVPAPPEGALFGKFTINGSGNKVMFSQGNLRANYNEGWLWSFSPNQWDYVGNNSANINITGNGTVSTGGYVYVDLFGWSTSATTYGIHNSQKNADYSGDFVDWGNTIGTGWRTLTSTEWAYLFNTRASGGTVGTTPQARYTMATIRTDVSGVNGVILFPDGVNFAATEFTTLGNVNSASAWGTRCTSAEWSALAAKGCVFLPSAGRRNGSSLYSAGADGYYWSSSLTSAYGAYYVHFNSGNLNYQSQASRCDGYSVRLVRAVE